MRQPVLNKTCDVVSDSWGPNSGELQTVIWPRNLKDWVFSVGSSIGDLTQNDADLEQQLVLLKEDVRGLSEWVQGARTFTDFMAARYPEIIREFNMVEEAKGRVAGADTVELVLR